MKEALIGDHGSEDGQNWTRSFAGMAIEPFEKEVADILMKPLDPADIEIKPGSSSTRCSQSSKRAKILCDYNSVLQNNYTLDGLLYLPEIKYRRILNQAFGPGGKKTLHL